MLSFLIYVVLAVFDLGLDMPIRIALNSFSLFFNLAVCILGGVFFNPSSGAAKENGGMT